MHLEELVMKLIKYKLGELIKQSDSRNNDRYDITHVKGISVKKEFIETRADMNGVSLKPYKIVSPDYYAYVTVTSRNGEKITIAHNDTDENYIVSSSYIVFYIEKKEILVSDYLFMFFNRPEFDRYSRYNSWGSARETFSWEDMCDIDIELPSIEIQKKYVNIYKSLLNNQISYEKGLDDLKLLCDAYIENLRRNSKVESIGKYIYRGEKNQNGTIKEVMGIGAEGFIKPQKDPNESLKGYKIMEKGAICYAPPLYNIWTGAIHYYPFDNKTVCSPIYEVFYCNKEKLLPEYLIMWLKREEFKRYAEFHGNGIRGTFDYCLMEELEIPIPKIEVQKAIADISNNYNKRIDINTKLKTTMADICRILIFGAINEAKED